MYSMTGFGRSEVAVGASLFTIEARSVNHRYLDLRLRLPPALTSLENALGEKVRARFERGSFDISIRQRLIPSANAVGTTRFVVDELAAQSLVDCAESLKTKFGISTKLSFDLFAQVGRVFVPVEETLEAESLFPQLAPAFEKALAELETMRKKEGAELARLLTLGVEDLQGLNDRIQVFTGAQTERISEKLQARIKTWSLPEVDAQRLEWEVAFYAERSDITEEIDRLRAHCVELLKLIRSESSVGRKIDFLIQEMHRETNTMGSKAGLVEITRLVVEAKARIEKLREQAQNVE